MPPDQYLPSSRDSLITNGARDSRLHLNDMFSLSYQLNGSVFSDKGSLRDVSCRITTSLIYSFSPWVERRIRSIFPDPKNENIFYANSPAVLWNSNFTEIIMVLRVWLVKERYDEKKNWPQNYFKDNYFYAQKFNRKMVPLDSGRLIGIPTTGAFTIGDGPIEPRLFRFRNRTLISFNTGIFFKFGMFDYTLLWDYDLNNVIVPEISGGSPMLHNAPKGDLPRDKHWAAFVDNDQLYFVQHLDPLRIMRCDFRTVTKLVCKFVYAQDNVNKFVFDDLKHHFRGGTPFELYQYPYFIGISHVTLFKAISDSKRVYTAHLVVMRVRPYRIVYTSYPIQIHQHLLNSVPIVRAKYIEDPFIFPVGLIVEDMDSITIGVHINDYSSVLTRVKGMRKLMRKIIRADRTQAIDAGPPENTIQTYIKNSVQNSTGYVFYDRSQALNTEHIL